MFFIRTKKDKKISQKRKVRKKNRTEKGAPSEKPLKY